MGKVILKNNQRKLKQEDKNDNFKDVWDGSVIIHNFHMEYGEIQNAHSYLFCFKKSCSEMLTNTLNFFIICDHISD